jgi:hypothetical protein
MLDLLREAKVGKRRASLLEAAVHNVEHGRCDALGGVRRRVIRTVAEETAYPWKGEEEEWPC